MDDTTIRLTFAVAGLVVGLVVGWTSRTARDARAIRKAVVNDETSPPRWWRKISRSDVVLGVVVLIVAGAAVQTAHVNDRLDDTQRCMTQAVAARDASSVKSRRALLDWLANTRAFLTQDRQSLAPLVDAIDDYTAATENTGNTVRGNDLRDCLD